MKRVDVPQVPESPPHAWRQEPRSSYERLEQLLETSPVGVMVVERERGSVRYANARSIEMLCIDARTPGTLSAADIWVRETDRQALARVHPSGRPRHRGRAPEGPRESAGALCRRIPLSAARRPRYLGIGPSRASDG